MALTEEWKRTFDDALTNPQWDQYDDLIRREIEEYNQRFKATPGFRALDWNLAKAILWVESGGPGNPAWTSRAMRIADRGDPGFHVLRGGQESAPAIISDNLRMALSGDINDPRINIRAGIAYLLTRLALSELQSVDDPINTKLRPYTVQAGDTWPAIAARGELGTTEQSLRQVNPGVDLQPGITIQVRKARVKRVITGWRPANMNTLSRYNGRGDVDFAAKLAYALALIPRLERGGRDETDRPMTLPPREPMGPT